MSPTSSDISASRPSGQSRRWLDWPRAIFMRLGVLPFMLIIAIVAFASLSDHFLSAQNLINVLRQSVYLVLVSLGQMLALVTGGFDLSVGTTIALTSVTSAMVMNALPGAGWMAVLAGCGAGTLAGLAVGLINGFGIAIVGVSPFIMTMGMQSIGFGIALFLTGGVPVSNIPSGFSDLFGFGAFLGVPVPILITIVCLAWMGILMARTPTGTHLLAVGGNIKAAMLSGINTRRVLMTAYLLCAGLAAISGLLLTARVESGDANLGGTIALESIAACVIAGVSLRGGIGKVPNVVLGSIFIDVVQNGMNLADIGSYLQMVVLGVLLIIAVIADQIRHKISSTAVRR